MAKSRFKITEFENPSGSVAFRVSGTLNGRLIRKNYKSRAEAIAARQQLDIQLLNNQSEGQTVWTTLTQDENHDAIAAINILKRCGYKKSLTFAANYLIRHYREEGEVMQAMPAVQEYVAEKEQELDKGIISLPHFRSLRLEMIHFGKYFSEQVVGEIQVDELKLYLNSARAGNDAAQSLKTWNNRRGYLSTFFKFCLRQRYTATNPILLVPQYKLKRARSSAETLTAKQAIELMQWLETYRGKQNRHGAWWGEPGCMVPYFVLTLFAGIRPDASFGEISRITSRDLRYGTDVITIEANASKVHERRTIKMQPNLRAWLEKYPIQQYPILPKYRFASMLNEARKTHNLGHDVLRHTYISMTVGAFRSVGDAALQAGNSEAVIRKHYLDLKSTEEAEQFWRITPAGTELPALHKREGRFVPQPAA